MKQEEVPDRGEDEESGGCHQCYSGWSMHASQDYGLCVAGVFRGSNLAFREGQGGMSSFQLSKLWFSAVIPVRDSQSAE